MEKTRDTFLLEIRLLQNSKKKISRKGSQIKQDFLNFFRKTMTYLDFIFNFTTSKFFCIFPERVLTWQYFKIMDILQAGIYLMNLKMQRPDGETTGLPQQASRYDVDGQLKKIYVFIYFRDREQACRGTKGENLQAVCRA